MGTLILPTSGSLYTDANSIIYSVQQHPTYAVLLNPLWQAQQTGRTAVSSDLTRMETLVLPFRLGDATLVADYRRLFAQQIVTLLPITETILEEAARLRAVIPGLKTPDAIHAATALIHGCTLFVTNDRGFARVPGLPLAMLDDILAAP